MSKFPLFPEEKKEFTIEEKVVEHEKRIKELELKWNKLKESLMQ